jgi:hypothetical protein
VSEEKLCVGAACVNFDWKNPERRGSCGNNVQLFFIYTFTKHFVGVYNNKAWNSRMLVNKELGRMSKEPIVA